MFELESYRSASGILRFMVFIGPLSSIFDISTFAFQFYIMQWNNIDQKSYFQTGWFLLSLFTQQLIIHVIRTPKIPFIQSIASIQILSSTILVIAAGFIAAGVPQISSLFGLSLPYGLFWAYLPCAVLCYCLLTHLAKIFYQRRFHEWI